MRTLLAPTWALAKGVTAEITVEAEYGDHVVEGSRYTAAHHGPRAERPAPCIDPALPVAPQATVLVSHLDLDTLGGLARIAGHAVAEAKGFWQAVAYVDVHGPHRAAEAPTWHGKYGLRFDAWAVWSHEHLQPAPSDCVSDVSSDVVRCLRVLGQIVDDNYDRIDAGREWREEQDALDAASLVSQHGRLLIRVSDRSTSALYRPDGDCILAFNTASRAITLSTAGVIPGIDCAAILREHLGPEAGGRRSIAGSPRGQAMTFFDAARVAEALVEALPPP